MCVCARATGLLASGWARDRHAIERNWGVSLRKTSEFDVSDRIKIEFSFCAKGCVFLRQKKLLLLDLLRNQLPCTFLSSEHRALYLQASFLEFEFFFPSCFVVVVVCAGGGGSRIFFESYGSCWCQLARSWRPKWRTLGCARLG